MRINGVTKDVNTKIIIIIILKINNNIIFHIYKFYFIFLK